MSKAPRPSSTPSAIAVTGANGSLGRLVLPRLLADPRPTRVLALDLARPALDHPRLSFTHLDLTRPSAAEELADALERIEARALVHLAFFSSPVADPAYAHEVEAIGTAHVIEACRRTGTALVMSSSTLVYGASPQNPAYLVEDRPLPASSPSRFVSDKIEAERQVQRYRAENPRARATILRFGPIVGPYSDNPVTRFLGHRRVPLVLGYDPLMQCLHEEDATEAVLRAVYADRSGVYNIVGRGILPLSRVAELAGRKPVSLPLPLARTALEVGNALGFTAATPSLIGYLRYQWIADGRRAEEELDFRPRYSSREALLSFAQTHRAAA